MNIDKRILTYEEYLSKDPETLLRETLSWLVRSVLQDDSHEPSDFVHGMFVFKAKRVFNVYPDDDEDYEDEGYYDDSSKEPLITILVTDRYVVVKSEGAICIEPKEEQSIEKIVDFLLKLVPVQAWQLRIIKMFNRVVVD